MSKYRIVKRDNTYFIERRTLFGLMGWMNTGAIFKTMEEAKKRIADYKGENKEIVYSE